MAVLSPIHMGSALEKMLDKNKGDANERICLQNYDDLPLFLNSETVAKVMGIAPSSAYELMHEPGFPVLKIGSRMVVPKEQFIRWVEEHTGGGK